MDSIYTHRRLPASNAGPDWYKPHLDHRRTTDYVYVVWWPEHQIVKAGITTKEGRWRKFMNRGARLLALTPYVGVSVERAYEGMFKAIGQRAFKSWQAAVPFLGAGGCGYTECYYIPDESLPILREIVRGDV